MRILFTGGAGYIGTETILRLVNDFPEASIRVYDNLSRGNFNLFIGAQKLGDRIELIEADLLDSRTLKKSLDGVDTVIHAAAKVTTPFADQNPHLFEQVNHWGTAELVYAIEGNSDVQRLIHLSSGSVYGSSSTEVDTSTELNPKTFYGISKMRAEEHVMRLGRKELDVHVLRCGNVFGYSKSMRFDSVINKFLFEANYRRRISINGSGEQHRSFVHIDRVAAVISSFVGGSIGPGTYNLVDRTISINQIADALKSIYPDLDMIFVNQVLRLRELKLSPSSILDSTVPVAKDSLEEQLKSFGKEFTF